MVLGCAVAVGILRTPKSPEPTGKGPPDAPAPPIPLPVEPRGQPTRRTLEAEVPLPPGEPRASTGLNETLPAPLYPVAATTAAAGRAPKPAANDAHLAYRRVWADLHPGLSVLSCDLRSVFPATSDHMVRVLASEVTDVSPLRLGDLRGGFFGAPVPTTGGSATLFIAGIGRAVVSWPGSEPGTVLPCTVDSFQPSFTLEGEVLGPAIAEATDEYVHGCGDKSPIDEDGYFMEVAPAGPCEIMVVVRVGGSSRFGPTVAVDPGNPPEGPIVLHRP